MRRRVQQEWRRCCPRCPWQSSASQGTPLPCNRHAHRHAHKHAHRHAHAHTACEMKVPGLRVGAKAVTCTTHVRQSEGHACCHLPERGHDGAQRRSYLQLLRRMQHKLGPQCPCSANTHTQTHVTRTHTCPHSAHAHAATASNPQACHVCNLLHTTCTRRHLLLQLSTL